MGGQKFQYDESGGTFFYFLLSFLALLLIPGTYYWWPRKEKEDPEEKEKSCHCVACEKKRELLSLDKPWQKTKQFITKVFIIGGWLFLAFLAYRVSQFDYEMANFDPYEILNIPIGASVAEVKKSYRKLSLIYHPDKETGDEKLFMKLTKAYQALTDEEAKRNLEKYGNPDGPGAMSFGIALPSWIVEKKNSVWVLGLYALVFMVALPTAVGIWWYSSIQYSGDKVLLDTSQLYYYFFHKTPSMPLKRVLMVLAASPEFDKRANNDIKERPTDNIEVPQLMRLLPQLNEKNKEQPLCREYSVKARALLHAHLTRIALNPDTLEKDRQQVVAKCPLLIQEMVSCTSQLVLLAYARRIAASKFLRIDTIENVMKLSPMIVQGLWDFKSPLLQLPHINEENLKYFVSKKRHIKTVQQFAQLKADERRAILRHLNDKQFEDVMKVVGSMPFLECIIKSEVIDDEKTTEYTAGAIITVTIALDRNNMGALLGDETVTEKTLEDAETVVDEKKEKEKEEKEPKVQKPVWQKQNKKQKATKKKKTRPAAQTKPAEIAKSEPNGTVTNGPKPSTGDDSDSERSDSQLSDDDADRSGDEDDETKTDRKETSAAEEDDDSEWDRIQRRVSKKDKILNSRGKISHSVHCPYYPQVKQEYWWVYICDRKNKSLLSAPYYVTNLVDKQLVELKFTAPKWPGVYTFTVCIRSDSYLGASQSHDIKFDVKEAPTPVAEHPQWDNVSDAEEKKSDQSDLSEYTTDEDVADDDDAN